MLGIHRNWKEFWQLYPVRDQSLSPFQEVGKTPITEQQFTRSLDDIFHLLSPESTDVVLDLCCGNGLITNYIAKKVQRVIGIDYSVPLIDKANQTKEGDNIEYRVFDAHNLPDLKKEYGNLFTKIHCNDALGYFTEKNLPGLLDNLLLLCKPGCRMVFGNVLNKKNLSSVYNTTSKKLEYHMLRLAGNRFGLGTWWNIDYIQQVAKEKGLHCEIHDQNELLHTSSHRKDMLIISGS